MHLRYQDRRTGIVTIAFIERHTLYRTMRRYKKRDYELVGYNLAPKPIRLANAR
jgi:hypothetical protein